MAFESESPLDSLWKEYGRAFQDWDDLTLARWLAQTLGELEGGVGRVGFDCDWQRTAAVAVEKVVHQ
jgi:hypothetical protein